MHERGHEVSDMAELLQKVMKLLTKMGIDPMPCAF